MTKRSQSGASRSRSSRESRNSFLWLTACPLPSQQDTQAPVAKAAPFPGQGHPLAQDDVRRPGVDWSRIVMRQQPIQGIIFKNARHLAAYFGSKLTFACRRPYVPFSSNPKGSFGTCFTPKPPVFFRPRARELGMALVGGKRSFGSRSLDGGNTPMMVV